MILYFTATGNSRWLAELLAEAMHDTAVSIVDCLKPVSYTHLDVYKRQEVCAPVHSVWNIPGRQGEYHR